MENVHKTQGGTPWLRWAIAMAIILAAILAVALLPVQQYVRALLEWTRDLGFWGYLVVIAFYVIGSVLLIPGSLVTLAAGFLFGLLAGFVTVSIGSTLGAASAFLVGRFLARARVERLMADRPRFRAIDRAVGREGFKIVLLTRLSPVFPFTILNYAYGLTSVPFWTYVPASWLGMIPGTFMYVYLGSTAKDLVAVFSGQVQTGTAQTALKVGGLIATIAVTVYVTHVARRALRESVEPIEPPK